MMGAAKSILERTNGDRSNIDDLVDALETERRLLDDMSLVLLRQREGVSGHDMEALDESVYAAQRILRTLQEARRRRRTLLRLLGGQEDSPLGEIELALGPAVTPAMRRARDNLVEAARRLARGLDVNGRVLEGAISVGDELMAALLGRTQHSELYSPHESTGTGTQSGALVNTKA